MTQSSEPERGFPTQEFEQRLAKAQTKLVSAGLDALFLTTEPEIRWFTGFLTRFWESPTRPWFLVVPAAGKPVAIIPSIGAHLMGQTWIEDIRTWRAPDLKDDGVCLLSDVLQERVGPSGKIGMPCGHETHLRMPFADFEALRSKCQGLTFTHDAGIMRTLRMVKSQAEIAKIKHACSIGAAAFEQVPDFAGQAMKLDDIFRQFQIACLQAGADWVSYVAGGAGPNGYGDVISPAGPQALKSGDILMLDTGAVWDGYFCDFDRNFSVGPPSNLVVSAWSKLQNAVDAAMDIAKPGATASDLFNAMNTVVAAGSEGYDAGRLGHGLGMQLTEWPSLIADDHTALEEGMVLTLEPGIETGTGRMLVHEENIVITKNGCEMLTPHAARELPVCR